MIALRENLSLIVVVRLFCFIFFISTMHSYWSGHIVIIFCMLFLIKSHGTFLACILVTILIFTVIS